MPLTAVASQILWTASVLAGTLVAAWVCYSRWPRKAPREPAEPEGTGPATRDPLTGLYSRALLFELGQKSLDLSQRHDRDLSLCLLELDGFKAFQDEHGRVAGAELLQQTCSRIQHFVRSADLSARVAAGRIAILMPETDLGGAQVVARRLQTEIRGTQFRFGKRRSRMTASFGITGMAPDDKELSALLVRAGEALAQARRTGRGKLSIG